MSSNFWGMKMGHKHYTGMKEKKHFHLASSVSQDPVDISRENNDIPLEHADPIRQKEKRGAPDRVATDPSWLVTWGD